jgi:hypothetical protein
MRAKNSARERRRLKHLCISRHAFSTFLVTYCTSELAIGRDLFDVFSAECRQMRLVPIHVLGYAVGYSHWT